MGIRMHLYVGYGLDMSQFPDLDRKMLDYDRLEDPALFETVKAAVFAEAEKNDDFFMEKAAFHTNMRPATDLADMAIYQNEFGDPDRLLLIPSTQKKSWSRYGNLLDAFLYEAQQKDMEFRMDTEWLPHPGTLYPYAGLMKPNPEKPLGIEKYWVSCYLDHPEHKDAIAWAPWHLWFVLRTLFDLTDERTTEIFLALRPGIYRTWG